MSKTLTERQCDFTAALGRLIVFIGTSDYKVKIHELNRSIETQKVYVATGKSKTMQSKHLDKLAVDIALVKDGCTYCYGEPFRPFGRFWESLGGVGGGSWGETPDTVGWDADHFEWGKDA